MTTETAQADGKVTARVVRDVVVDGTTAIPAGARLEGLVTLVERGRPFPGRDKVGIRFTTLILADNKRVAIQTDTIFRESDPPGEPSASLGASAALGALLMNGRRQTAPGSAGLPALTSGDTRNARIPGGSLLTVKLIAPVSIVIDKNPLL